MTAVLICTAVLSFGQELPQLPNDPETKVGKLENGLTYYIRHNEKPANRAEFYLATNVGAIQETPDQDGLAHFLEHMCFNGTKNFPGKGILNWLESIGASFGGNVNASTGVEQTIYLLNNIPLVRPTVVDTCLLIMHDYSHFVTCDPAEIDAERGVILEEKRSRNNASWRMREAGMPYLYGDSKYNGCTIIGSEENLKTFKPESLVNFYKTWYRPDMQALIVVGDIDVDEVEAKIKTIFADIPAAENPKAKDVIKIPDNKEPIVGILTDPENTGVNFTVYWKSEPTPEALNSTAVGLMTDLIKQTMSLVMSERFDDLSSGSNAPFIAAGFGMGKLTETCEVVLGQVNCKDGQTMEGFKALMTELEKMSRFGFTDAEVKRAQTEIISQLENAASRADTRSNSQFVYPYIYNFFDNMPFMTPQTELELVKAIMPQISATVINQVATQILTRENMVILYEGIEKEGNVHPTEAQILETLTAVQNAEIEQVAGEEIPTEFLDPSTLKGSKIKKTSKTIYDATKLTLANGAEVILYPVDHEKNRISITIEKKGGQSLISDEDMASFESNIFSLYQSNTGIAQFPKTTVNKMLAGKEVSVHPFIEAYTHGISASTTQKDLETALQMAYLYYTQPRFDEEEYNQGIAQIESILPNLKSTPNWALSEKLYGTIYDSPRRMLISEEVIAKANLATIEKNWKQLFKDAAGVSVIIAGDFDPETVTPLVQKYIGSLPKGKKATDWSYREDGYVKGKKIEDFRTKMSTPMVTVVQIYSADKKYSIKDAVSYSALSYILNMVYTETMRESEGGTYGAQAAATINHEPLNISEVQVQFQTNEAQADRLRELALEGIKTLATNGPSADHFEKTVKNLEKNISERKQSNNYWAGAINQYVLYGFDHATEYEAAVSSLTPEDIKAAAAEILNSGNFLEVVMRPEK